MQNEPIIQNVLIFYHGEHGWRWTIDDGNGRTVVTGKSKPEHGLSGAMYEVEQAAADYALAQGQRDTASKSFTFGTGWCVCQRCGNRWRGREKHRYKAPVRCASCRSKYWNKPRVRKQPAPASEKQGGRKVRKRLISAASRIGK